MVLCETAEARDVVIGRRIAESLDVCIRLRSKEIIETAEKIEAAEAVGRRDSLADAIDRRASLPKMIPRRSRIDIGGLIMILATRIVSLKRPAEICEACDIDAGSGGVVRA